MVGSKRSAPKAETKAAVGPFQVSLQPGWNLFAMPFSNPTTFSISQPSAVLSCYGYNATTGAYYLQSFSLAGFTQPSGGPANQYQGYWVFCTSPVTVTVDGADSAQNPLQTQLLPGFNLVGNPLNTNVSLAALDFASENLVSAQAGGLVGPQAYTYSPATAGYNPLA